MAESNFAILTRDMFDRYHHEFTLINEFQNKCQIGLDAFHYSWSDNPLLEWSRCVEYPLVANIIKEKLFKNDVKICDFGCGISFMPIYFSDMGFNVTCFDIVDYSEFYSCASSKINHQINFTQELAVNHFDLIYSVSVIEHTKDPDAELEKIYDSLKSGGEVILTFDIDPRGDLDLNIVKAVNFITKFQQLFNSVSSAQLDSSNSDYLTFKNSPYGRRKYTALTRIKRTVKKLACSLMRQEYHYDIYDLRVGVLTGKKP